jgi:hypothetical protein
MAKCDGSPDRIFEPVLTAREGRRRRTKIPGEPKVSCVSRVAQEFCAAICAPAPRDGETIVCDRRALLFHRRLCCCCTTGWRPGSGATRRRIGARRHAALDPDLPGKIGFDNRSYADLVRTDQCPGRRPASGSNVSWRRTAGRSRSRLRRRQRQIPSKPWIRRELAYCEA